MKRYRRPFIGSIICLIFLACSSRLVEEQALLSEDARIASIVVDSKKENLKFYWKGEGKQGFRSFGKLKKYIESKGRELTFAMNGGMFDNKREPVGLYIENGLVKKKLNKIKKKSGNFYLQPNGVFYLKKDGSPVICTSQNFEEDISSVEYATQSGPMLLVDGNIHSVFRQGSENKHIRNGVGILPNGKLLFAISKEKINFYDFASFFKKNACRNALYLDGFVSRAYMPQQNIKQLDGDFGVIIGIEQ